MSRNFNRAEIAQSITDKKDFIVSNELNSRSRIKAFISLEKRVELLANSTADEFALHKTDLKKKFDFVDDLFSVVENATFQEVEIGINSILEGSYTEIGDISISDNFVFFYLGEIRRKVKKSLLSEINKKKEHYNSQFISKRNNTLIIGEMEKIIYFDFKLQKVELGFNEERILIDIDDLDKYYMRLNPSLIKEKVEYLNKKIESGEEYFMSGGNFNGLTQRQSVMSSQNLCETPIFSKEIGERVVYVINNCNSDIKKPAGLSMASDMEEGYYGWISRMDSNSDYFKDNSKFEVCNKLTLNVRKANLFRAEKAQNIVECFYPQKNGIETIVESKTVKTDRTVIFVDYNEKKEKESFLEIRTDLVKSELLGEVRYFYRNSIISEEVVEVLREGIEYHSGGDISNLGDSDVWGGRERD